VKELAVEIVRCADVHHQPGWVEVESVDVEGHRHTLGSE